VACLGPHPPTEARVRSAAPNNPGAPQSLAGRRMWEGRRHLLRRGPRQAHAYAVGFSSDGRYLSWGHTAVYTSPNHQGPLEHRFDLIQPMHLRGGISNTSHVQALERFGTLSLMREQGGLISTTPVSTCKTARDGSALATYISGEQLRERFYRPELIQATLPGEPHTSPQNTVHLHTDQ
jgi:hypothetical protein